MPSTSIEFEHPKGNSADGPDAEEICVDEIEIDLGYEQGESSYGADADGNRGISVPGYFYPDMNPPEKCSSCGHLYTLEEQEEIEKAIQAQAEQYTQDYEPNEPDMDWPDFPED